MSQRIGSPLCLQAVPVDPARRHYHCSLMKPHSRRFHALLAERDGLYDAPMRIDIEGGS